MSENKCAYDFNELTSEKLKNYLSEKCPTLMEAQQCMSKQKDLYAEAVRPMIENPSLVAKLDKEAQLLLLGANRGFGDYNDDGTPKNNVTVKGTISSIKIWFDKVDPETTKLNEIYDFHLNYFTKKESRNDRFLKLLVVNSKELIRIYNDEPYGDPTGYFTEEFSESEREQLKQISEGASEARKTQRAAKKCAKIIKDIEDGHKEISAEDVGLITAREGSVFETPEESKARADKAEEAIVQSGASAGTGIGIFSLPENFREQCLFLAQIFQFAEYHRDVQMGGESENFDAQDFAARSKTKIKQGLSPEVEEIPVDKLLPYVGSNKNGNSSIVVEGEAFGFINKLTQYASMNNFFDATNDQLAHLQPMIRLFKVTPASGKKEQQFEFPFDTFASIDDVKEIYSRQSKRGFGAGIQNFNFTFHGSNPFAIKKSIKASLKIRANNFEELLKPRTNGLRYIDLALKTGTAIEEKYNKSELNFRIKAVVGLSLPNGLTTKNYKSIKEGVKNNFATLNLTPVTHTFDFDETGAVTFSIEYLAYVEEYFDKARMNIFADPEINKRIIQRRLGILSQKKNCQDESDVTKLNKFIEQDAEQVKKDKIKSLQFLTNEMLSSDLIYYLNLTKEQFINFVRTGPFYSLSDVRKSISPADENDNSKNISKQLEESFNAKYSDSSENNQLKNSFSISGIENKNFPFFYLGDLVDLILKKIPQNLQSLRSIPEKYLDLEINKEILDKEQKIISNSIEQFKKFRFIMGPLEIVDHKDQSKTKAISFADLPISLSYFNEWLTSKLLAKDEASYGLTTFLNDLMNDFVTNFLNDDSCFSYNIKQRARVFQNVITSYSKEDTNDSITTYLETKGLSRLNLQSNQMQKPILTTAGYRDFDIPHKDPDKEFHFFVFYAGRVQPKSLMTGDREGDLVNGIFHYVLGRDKGIVKTIKLNKTDSPSSLKMVRFEQEGYDGLRQLREIYDVDVTTFTNVQTYPGTYVYVEPQGFSPSMKGYDLDKFDLTDLGIGGYYMIIESTHEFAPGVMNTSFRAKWVQSIDNENQDMQKVTDSSVGNGNPTFKKCSVRA